MKRTWIILAVLGLVVLLIGGGWWLRSRTAKPLTQIAYGTNSAATLGDKTLVFNGRQLYQVSAGGQVTTTSPEQVLPAMQSVQYSQNGTQVLFQVDTYSQGDFLYQTMQKQLGSFSASFTWWRYDVAAKTWQVVPFELSAARFTSDGNLLGVRKPGARELKTIQQSIDSSVYANPVDEVVNITGNTAKLLAKGSDIMDASLLQNTVYAITRDPDTKKMSLVSLTTDKPTSLLQAGLISFSPSGNYAVVSNEQTPERPTTKLVSGRTVDVQLVSPTAADKPIWHKQAAYLSWGWSSNDATFVSCQQKTNEKATALSCQHLLPVDKKIAAKSQVSLPNTASVLEVSALGQDKVVVTSGNGLYTSGSGQAINATNLARFEKDNSFIHENGSLLLPIFAPYQVPPASSFTSSAGITTPPAVMGFRYFLFGAPVY